MVNLNMNKTVQVLRPSRNWTLEQPVSRHCVVKISRQCHRIASFLRLVL